MVSKTLSSTVYGIDTSLIEVEVNISPDGNGEFQIAGLPDAAIRESRSGIHSAIRNSGFEVPFRKITVNLAPAGIRKEGAEFDLPMRLCFECGQSMHVHAERDTGLHFQNLRASSRSHRHSPGRPIGSIQGRVPE